MITRPNVVTPAVLAFLRGRPPATVHEIAAGTGHHVESVRRTLGVLSRRSCCRPQVRVVGVRRKPGAGHHGGRPMKLWAAA